MFDMAAQMVWSAHRETRLRLSLRVLLFLGLKHVGARGRALLALIMRRAQTHENKFQSMAVSSL